MGHRTKFWWGLGLGEDMDKTVKKSNQKLEPSATSFSYVKAPAISSVPKLHSGTLSSVRSLRPRLCSHRHGQSSGSFLWVRFSPHRTGRTNMCTLLPCTIYIGLLENLWYDDFILFLNYRLHSVLFCMRFCCAALWLDNPTLHGGILLLN